MANTKALAAAPHGDVAHPQDLPAMLAQVREEWRSKKLIERVEKLLPVDPSSACQRLLNASIHDLREKIQVAGLDIASEAARQHKLPTIAKAEDIEQYTTTNILQLAYRMGLLPRPAWRRLQRAYDIRKDLEHEDDEYEASRADCLYVFEACVSDVLSQDPIQVIKLTEVKEVVEQSRPSLLEELALKDFEHAPGPRQKEICQYLISVSLDTKKPDIVRQNCYHTLTVLHEIVQREVLIDIAKDFVSRIGRKEPSETEFRVAHAAGVVPYLKKLQRSAFFNGRLKALNAVSHRWSSHESHGSLLAGLEEISGLKFCPKELLDGFVEWLILCYIGEPGGYGRGINRPVFFSDVGASICLRILRMSELDSSFVDGLRESSSQIQRACSNKHVARRLEHVIDAIGQ